MHTALFFTLLLTFLCGPASAQFYRYIDKDGVVRYTDDLSQVPEDRQAEVEKYVDTEDTQTGGKDSKKTVKPETPDQVKQEKKLKKPGSAQAEKKALKEQKKELKNEYQALMKEKEQIARDIETYSKRYKTRARKSASRKKLIELKAQEVEWEKKFNDYKAKKRALEMLEQKPTAKEQKGPSAGIKAGNTDGKR
jgi:hypothetical protein